MEQATTQPTNETKRPVFLTVLCILSFIAAGFGIIGYLGAIALAGIASAAVSNMSTDAMASYTGPSVGLIWAYIIVGIITTLVTLFAVIKMWKLQKVGFYIYVACAVISLIMSIVYGGISSAIVSIIISAVFIVLYGLNLKHMK